MRRALAIALAAAVLSGCAMRVHTEDPRALVTVDGQTGRGEVRVRRAGPPHTARVTVRGPDGRRASTTVKRSFSAWTAIGALYTYGICLIVCWTYPEQLYVPLPPRATTSWDAWEGAADDPWLQPPGTMLPPQGSQPPDAEGGAR